MDEIPTYEELKKRVREQEKETTELRRAKEMLRLEKDKFQLIMSGLSSAEIGIDIVGIDYTVIFQNQFLEDRFGNLTGWLCYEKYMGMEEPCDFCPMVQAVRNNKIENVELAGNDGRVYEVFSTPLPNPDGTVDKAFEIVRDITNRKRAEEVLKESEEKFRSALMGLPIMVNAVDQNGTIVFWNKKCEEITGYTATEMIGNCNAMELLYPDKEYLETELQKWKTQNYKLKNAELVSRAKDGSAKTVLWTNPDFSTPEWIWAVGIDITKQKREEVALHEAYRIINRSPAVAILWKNMEGWPVEFVSDNVMELFGYAAENFTSGQVSYAKIVHPDDLERVAKEVATFSNEKTRTGFVHVPYRIIAKDGKVRWLDDRTYIRRDNKGTITHYEAIVVDITDSVQTAKVLRENKEKLARYKKMESLGLLAGGVAHDLNNVLSGIVSYPELLLLELPADSPFRKAIETIKESGNRAVAIVQDLLTVARWYNIRAVFPDNKRKNIAKGFVYSP